MDPAFIGMFAIMGVFGLPALSIWTSHRRKVLEMKLQASNQNDQSLVQTVEQLRSELRAMRDTSTQYDMSLDTALQRLEHRVDSLETHAISTRSESAHSVELRSGR